MPDALLDLDATRPPGPPPKYAPRHRTIMAKMPADLVEWAREQAAGDNVAVNTWLKRLVQREREGVWLPPDCVEWLVRQAAQCGMPGDPRGALVEVLRHLAVKWPDGGRLKP